MIIIFVYCIINILLMSSAASSTSNRYKLNQLSSLYSDSISDGEKLNRSIEFMLKGSDHYWNVDKDAFTPNNLYGQLIHYPEFKRGADEELLDKFKIFKKEYDSTTGSKHEKLLGTYVDEITTVEEKREIFRKILKQRTPQISDDVINGYLNLPKIITDFIDQEFDKTSSEFKEGSSVGGRRRKTNKVRKSKMRVFRRRSIKSKKSRKSRKYVR